MTKIEASTIISAATDLASLRAACATIDSAAAAADLDAQHLYDATDLPTFGGAEPASTSEVWSWDATHLLVGTGPAAAMIVAR